LLLKFFFFFFVICFFDRILKAQRGRYRYCLFSITSCCKVNLIFCLFEHRIVSLMREYVPRYLNKLMNYVNINKNNLSQAFYWYFVQSLMKTFEVTTHFWFFSVKSKMNEKKFFCFFTNENVQVWRRWRAGHVLWSPVHLDKKQKK